MASSRKAALRADGARITRLSARNFLSLRDVNLDLDRPLNVLVGPNMAGKSNLIQCLKFLQEALCPDANDQSAFNRAFSSRGGFGEIAWKGRVTGPIELEYNAEIPESFNYELRIRWDPEYKIPQIESETL